MNIISGGASGIQNDFGLFQTAAPAQSRELAQAVQRLNASSFLPEGREVSFSIDPKTKIPVVRVLDTNTREVLTQLPAEYVLRVAAFLDAEAAQETSSKNVPSGR